MTDFSIPVEEEIQYLANRLTEEDRKKMFLANAFRSDAQRRFVMAKLRNGEPGGNPYGDPTEIMEGRLKDMYEQVEEVDKAIKDSGLDLNKPVDFKEFKKVMNMGGWCNYDAIAWYHRYNELANREAVKNDILQRALYLANKELTDEQRKAIFAKNGGGGGSGQTKVYTVASPNGNVGGNGNRGPTGPLTVTNVSEIEQEKPNYKMGDLLLQDGTRIPGDKIKDYLGAAYSEGSNTINAGLLTTEQKKQLGLIKDPTAGATAVALDPSTGKPFAEGQGSWSHLQTTSPTQQIQQDITGSASTGGGGSTTTTTTTTTTGGGGASAGDVGGAIDSLDLSGDSGGPTAEQISAANLSAFQQALANAHF